MGQKLTFEVPDRVLRVLASIARQEGQTPEQIATRWMALKAEEIIGDHLERFLVAQQLLKEKREEILTIGARHGVNNIRIFGSFALGKADSESDLDLLVTLQPGRTLLDMIGAKHDLEDFLGVPVDILTEAAISPYIRDKVLREAVPL